MTGGIPRLKGRIKIPIFKDYFCVTISRGQMDATAGTGTSQTGLAGHGHESARPISTWSILTRKMDELYRASPHDRESRRRLGMIQRLFVLCRAVQARTYLARQVGCGSLSPLGLKN